jgi:hypothetical protein
VEQPVRRIGTLNPRTVASTAAALASLILCAGLVVAFTAGPIRLSAVAAAATFLLIVGVGLYASRLGAPGRSA